MFSLSRKTLLCSWSWADRDHWERISIVQEIHKFFSRFIWLLNKSNSHLKAVRLVCKRLAKFGKMVPISQLLSNLMADNILKGSTNNLVNVGVELLHSILLTTLHFSILTSKYLSCSWITWSLKSTDTVRNSHHWSYRFINRKEPAPKQHVRNERLTTTECFVYPVNSISWNSGVEEEMSTRTSKFRLAFF